MENKKSTRKTTESKRYRITWTTYRRNPQTKIIEAIDNVRVATLKNNKYVDADGELIGFPSDAKVIAID